MFLSACAMPGATPEATQTPAPTITITPTVTLEPTTTLTPSPTITPTFTLTPNLTATEERTAFSETLEELYKAGYVSTKEGFYKKLPDNIDELSKINYYQRNIITGSEGLKNFIVRSDIAWESASAAADNSGCGFSFHMDGSDSYIFYVSLKGFVRLNGYLNASWTRFGGSSYGAAQQNGQVNLTLIIEDATYRVLVNDKLIKTYQGFAGKMSSGSLAYTLLSGTNKSFGTRCKFTNTVLWIQPIKIGGS